MHSESNKLDIFFDKKPVLNEQQSLMLSSFYRLSQERSYRECVPQPIFERDIFSRIERYGAHGYPDDIYVMIIHAIDDFFISREIEAIDAKRLNNGN